MTRWLTHNWGLKLVSFFLAVGLWYYATGEEGIEVTRVIPVEIKVKNPHMSISKVSARNVEVTLIAPRALLSDLTSENLKAQHEIEENISKPGDYSFRLEPGEIHLRTPQIRVVKIQPETIQVTLDELIVQKLAVKPNFLGEPAFGYGLNPDEVQINPNAVLIEGPRSRLEKLDSVKTSQIDLVGRVRSFRRMYSLDLPANLKAVSDDMIDVYVPIIEAYDEKTFENIPVKILGNQGKNVGQLNPSEVTLTLRGPRKQFQDLSSGSLNAFVDVTDQASGDFELPLQVILPDGVTQKNEKPVSIHGRIEK